jgi:transposase-like protein
MLQRLYQPNTANVFLFMYFLVKSIVLKKENSMAGEHHSVLSRIKTVSDMVDAFRDEEQCRRLLEQMVWSRGRICPACGFRESCALAGRDTGAKARPGLYQCANGACRHQFTVTTHTPLHSTKLPLRIWLTAMWLILQSDKGISSIGLAEAVGVSQPTAWRMGHAIRLMLAREAQLDGIVETDEFYIGGSPRHNADLPKPGRGRKGRPRTTKTPVLTVIQRPLDLTAGAPAGEARARIVKNLSEIEASLVLEDTVEPTAHLMSDEWKSFMSAGQGFAAHDTVCHSQKDFVRGIVHVNSAEGFSDRVRRTIVGVFHHISPVHANLYFNEIGFRWSQRTVVGQVVRKTRKGRSKIKTVWDKTPPALQLPAALRSIVGRQMRRSEQGGISIKSNIAVFG